MLVLEVDNVLRRFNNKCFTKFKASIPFPSPVKTVDNENEEEQVGMGLALELSENDGGDGKCEALGNDCQWQELSAGAVCVACHKSMHTLCGEKFDDGVGLEDEVHFKCNSCAKVNLV